MALHKPVIASKYLRIVLHKPVIVFKNLWIVSLKSETFCCFSYIKRTILYFVVKKQFFFQKKTKQGVFFILGRFLALSLPTKITKSSCYKT